MIAHIQTVVTTIFGTLDQNGDVEKTPITIEIKRLDEESFIEAFRKLLEVKKSLASNNPQHHG